MVTETTMENNRHALMGETPINRLIPRLAVPTMISMLVTSIYNMADTYFVHFLGTAATAAVGVNLSLEQIIMMAGSFLAVGANSYVARLLGAKDQKKASKVLSTAFFSALFFGLAVMVVGLIFLKPLVILLGARDEVLPYAMDYASYMLIVAPIMASSFVLNHCLRSEGSAVYSMFGLASGAVLNIALDPLFILTFDMGVKGAAIATAISKVVSFVILILPYFRGKSILHLSVKNIQYSRDIIYNVTSMGSASLIRTGLSVLSGILLNNMASMISDAVLAGVTVANKIANFLTSALLGFAQGFQPVAGYNWGAKRYDRVQKSFWFSVGVGVAGSILLSALLAVFAREVVLLFETGSDEMLQVGVLCLRLQCLAMPFHAFCVFVNMLHAGIGKAVGAAVLATTRQGTCFIPFAILLPKLFGVQGLTAVQAVADMISLVVAIPFAVHILRYINAHKAEQDSLESKR